MNREVDVIRDRVSSHSVTLFEFAIDFLTGNFMESFYPLKTSLRYSGAILQMY